MHRRWVCGLLAAFLAASGPARSADKLQQWLEVRSPHFFVLTNGTEKQARRVAQQFERIRAVFHQAFPRARVDTGAPILALAAKDEKSFKALEPKAWQKKGQLERAGMFLPGPEKNFVLLRLDEPSEEGFHIVLHEFAHLLLNQDVKSLPLWLDEGLAEFYGNSEVSGKEALLGKPSGPHLLLLRDKKLLPLEVLFKVDHTSPYYNEENKGSIFYAESWALTHYLMIKAPEGGKNPLLNFVALVNQDVDSATAAQRAFGDLAKLQKDLENYVRQAAFGVKRMRSFKENEDLAYTAREVTSPESAAIRGDFLAHLHEYSEARALLEEALKGDPQDALAHESMGFMELQQGHLEEARKWFTEAVRLDSRSYLAHYYFAVMGLRETASGENAHQVEESFRTVMSLNPGFAPAYEGLAAFYGMRGERLEEAHKLALRAVELEPNNPRFRVTIVNIMLRMKRVDDAIRVSEGALAMAKTPEEQAYVQGALDSAHKMQEYNAEVQRSQEQARAENEQFKRKLDEVSQQAKARAETASREDAEAAAVRQSAPAETIAKGVPGWSAGKVIAASCNNTPNLELTLQSTLTKLRLHAPNYSKIEFLTATWKPPDPFNPCKQLEGHQTAITFRSFKGSPYDGEIVSVEVRK